jgi:hypothetical protein
MSKIGVDLNMLSSVVSSKTMISEADTILLTLKCACSGVSGIALKYCNAVRHQMAKVRH